MRISIQRDDADRLGSDVRQWKDPLDLGCTAVDNVLAVARDMLAGSRPVPQDATLLPVDEIGVAILVHLGVHPAAAAALASAANGIGLETDDGEVVGEILMDTPPFVRLSVDGLHWNGSRLRIPALPETMLAALPTDDVDDLEEVPLERVLSHPALDGLRASIMWVESESDAPDTNSLILSTHARAQTRHEMDRAWNLRHTRTR